MTLVRAVEGSRGLVDNDAMAIGSDGSFQVAVDGDGTVLGLEVGETTLIEAAEGRSGLFDDGAMAAGNAAGLKGGFACDSDVETVQRHALCG